VGGADRAWFWFWFWFPTLAYSILVLMLVLVTVYDTTDADECLFSMASGRGQHLSFFLYFLSFCGARTHARTRTATLRGRWRWR
jgi:hypothetical protein